MFSSALTAVVRILGSSAVWLEEGSCEVEGVSFPPQPASAPQSNAPHRARESSLFSWVSSFHLLFYANTDNLPGLHRENGVGQAVGAVHIVSDKQKSTVELLVVLFQDTHDGIGGNQIKPLSTSSRTRYLGRMDMAAPGRAAAVPLPDSCRAGTSKSRSSMWVSSMSSPMRSPALPL